MIPEQGVRDFTHHVEADTAQADEENPERDTVPEAAE
jgi:hypothetical protein